MSWKRQTRATRRGRRRPAGTSALPSRALRSRPLRPSIRTHFTREDQTVPIKRADIPNVPSPPPTRPRPSPPAPRRRRPAPPPAPPPRQITGPTSTDEWRSQDSMASEYRAVAPMSRPDPVVPWAEPSRVYDIRYSRRDRRREGTEGGLSDGPLLVRRLQRGAVGRDVPGSADLDDADACALRGWLGRRPGHSLADYDQHDASGWTGGGGGGG